MNCFRSGNCELEDSYHVRQAANVIPDKQKPIENQNRKLFSTPYTENCLQQNELSSSKESEMGMMSLNNISKR